MDVSRPSLPCLGALGYRVAFGPLLTGGYANLLRLGQEIPLFFIAHCASE